MTGHLTRFPSDILAGMLAADPGRPRLTWYDDAPGESRGERIELSAKVLVNWVSKAGNLLQDDLAAGPGTTVGLDLPSHWRAAYWALATWSVGATVVLGSAVAGADVLVTDDPTRAAEHGGDAVLVSLPALSRSHPRAGEAAGAVDEARELSTHGDLFTAMAIPEATDLALSRTSAPGAAGDTAGDRAGDRAGDTAGNKAYADLVAARLEWGAAPRVALRGGLADVLRDALSAWAGGGSVVLMRGPDGPDGHAARLTAENVTVDRRSSAT